MNDIDLIYCNNFGASFYLKRCTIKELNKVQVVFNKIAFYFTKDELLDLQDAISASIYVLDTSFYDRKIKETIVLVFQISNQEMTVKLRFLCDLNNLIRGTLFHINFEATMARLLRL